jgi:Rrf2 family protein
MWLNSTAQNALRAVLFIAEAEGVEPVRVDDVAAALECPRNYLSKTLHTLTRAGVLTSLRGRHGGFRLADAPSALVLSRVIGPFQPAGERRCLLGQSHCGIAPTCFVHDRWTHVASQVEDFFGKTTIAELLRMDPAVRPL